MRWKSGARGFGGGLLASIPVAGKRRKRTREAELWWSCHQWHHLALRGAVQTSDSLDLSWAGGRGNFRAPADWWLVQAPWGEAVTLGGKALHLRQPPWGADNESSQRLRGPSCFWKQSGWFITALTVRINCLCTISTWLLHKHLKGNISETHIFTLTPHIASPAIVTSHLDGRLVCLVQTGPQSPASALSVQRTASRCVPSTWLCVCHSCCLEYRPSFVSLRLNFF